MVNRIVIYGWIIPQDKTRGAGSGSLVDLIYFVDDNVTVSDVWNIISNAGYKIIPKRIGNQRNAPVENDKITVEDWQNNISQKVTVGSEQMPENYQINYDRYNRPEGL